MILLNLNTFGIVEFHIYTINNIEIINDNLSISYNEHNNTYKKAGAGPDVEQQATGMAIAYTMGGAKLAIQNNEMDNVKGTSGTNDEITEVSLTLAF
mgnify:CR=1 FL=1